MWRYVSSLVAVLGLGLLVFAYFPRNSSHRVGDAESAAASADQHDLEGHLARRDLGEAVDSLRLQAARRKEDLVVHYREALAAAGDAAELLSFRTADAKRPKSTGPLPKPTESPGPSLQESGSEPAPAKLNAHPPPDFVPWPPPVPTASSKLDDWMRQFRTVGELSAALEQELERGGYSQFSYSWVPNGFALVTQVEQLDDSESPLSEHRFAPSECYIPLSEMRITVAIFSSMKGLLFEREDRCRLYVFFLTDDPSPPQEYPAEKFNQHVVRNWVEKGRRSLTKAEKDKPISDDYIFYVNEYEFIKHKGEDPQQAPVSELSAIKHLELTGCSFALK